MSRPESARYANQQIAARAERLRFVSRIPMLCECDDVDCRQIFLIKLDEYRRARRQADFLTVPGHHVAGADTQTSTHDYWIQRQHR